MTNESMQVLLIDDDDVDVEAVRRLVAHHREPVTITVCRDGREACDLLSSDRGRRLRYSPYLILLDLNMPRMNGIAFLDWLRQEPTWARSIVFAFSTSEEPLDFAQAYDRGVAGYLAKGRMGEGYELLHRVLHSMRESVTFPPACEA